MQEHIFCLGEGVVLDHILGQVWCLIVSIPDLCPLSYFGEGSEVMESCADLIWHSIDCTILVMDYILISKDG